MSNVLPFYQASFTSNDIILLDTSFLLNSVGFNNSPIIEAECNNLIANIANAGAMCCIPEIAKSELSHVITKETFNINGFKNEHSIKQLRKSQPTIYENIFNQAYASLNSYFYILENNPIIYPKNVGIINDDLHSLARKIGYDFKLYGSNDSILIATAVNENINYIASTDKDLSYINIKNLTILIDNNNYINNYDPNSVQAQIEYNL